MSAPHAKKSRRQRSRDNAGADGSAAATAAVFSTAVPATRSAVPPADGSCPLLSLDEELLASCALFLSGASLARLSGAARSLRALGENEWLWETMAAQEFGGFDGMPMPDARGRVLGEAASNADASASSSSDAAASSASAAAVSSAAAAAAAAAATAVPSCRASRPHALFALHYPVDLISAHVSSSAESGAAAAAAAPSLEELGGEGEHEEPRGFHGRGGRGGAPGLEEPPPGADIPCELVRMERRAWTSWTGGNGTRISTRTQPASAFAADAMDDVQVSPSPSPSPSPPPANDEPATSSPSTRVASLRAAYANLHATAQLRCVRWVAQESLVDEGGPSRPGAGRLAQPLRPVPPSEAHTLVAVGRGRNLLLCVTGFARFGPSADILVRRVGAGGVWRRALRTQEVDLPPAGPAADSAASSLNRRPCHPVLSSPPSGPEAAPRWGLYGAAILALDERHVLVASGLRSGGYSGQSRRCYLLKVEDDGVDAAAAEEEATRVTAGQQSASAWASDASSSPADSAASSSSFEADSLADPARYAHLRWVPLPLCARTMPQPHCYGSIALHYNPSSSNSLPPRVLVYGGLDEHDASDALSILDLSSMQWEAAAGRCTGSKPPAMHSHTGVVIGDTMWLIGGATGNDPPRSGRDLQRVYSLDLCNMHWRDRTDDIGGRRPTLDRRIKGHVVGDRIVFVGADSAKDEQKHAEKGQKRGGEKKGGELRQRRSACVAAQRQGLPAAAVAASSSSSTASAAASSAAAPAASSSVATRCSKRARAASSSSSFSSVAAAAQAREARGADAAFDAAERAGTAMVDDDDAGEASLDPADDASASEAEEDEDAEDDEDEDAAEGLESESEAESGEDEWPRWRWRARQDTLHPAGVFVLNTSTLRWEWPTVLSPAHAPQFPRYASSAVVAGDSLTLFGGCYSSGHTMGDTWTLQLNAGLREAGPAHAARFVEAEREERRMAEAKQRAEQAAAERQRRAAEAQQSHGRSTRAAAAAAAADSENGSDDDDEDDDGETHFGEVQLSMGDVLQLMMQAAPGEALEDVIVRALRARMQRDMEE